MLLLEPDRTPYDLRWRMFGIDVRVHPMFWLVSALMGSNALQDREQGLQLLLLWIACTFVSILVHELGHVVMGLFFGSEGHVVLYSFGGLAIGSNNLRNRWQRIAVSFAGPGAGFLFLAAVLVLVWVTNPATYFDQMERLKRALGIAFDEGKLIPLFAGGRSLAREAVRDLIWINLFWGLINLIPVWPLDGGQISRDFLDGVHPGKGLRYSLILSMVVAGVLVAQSLAAMKGLSPLPFPRGWFPAIMFAILGLNSYWALQQLPPDRPAVREEDLQPWERWERERERW